MDFSLTTLYVLPVSNTLPTTGSTANLTAGQFGVFKPDYTPATVANVASQPFIMLAQGRQQNYPGVGTKKSDKIYLNNVTEWYKVTANSSVVPQIITFSNWDASCGEDVTISLRLKSFYIDTGYFNGKTQSYTLTTPCCDCGTDPCTTLADADIVSMIADFIDKINDTNINGNNPLGATSKNANSISAFVTATAGGTSGARTLIVTGKTLAAEPTSADPTVFSYQFNRLYFWGFAYKGPATSQDYNVWDSCDPFATVTTTQLSNYPTGDYKQAVQLEKNFWSNNTAQIAKRLWSNVNFNGAYTSEVITNQYYDFYYLKYTNPRKLPWVASVSQDESVIILNPTGQNAGTISVLTTFLGNPINES